MRTAALVIAFGLAGAACRSNGLSKEKCDAMFQRADQLILEALGAKGKPSDVEHAMEGAKDALREMKDKCVKDGTSAIYECAMSAKTKTFDDFMKCGS